MSMTGFGICVIGPSTLLIGLSSLLVLPSCSEDLNTDVCIQLL